MKLSKNIIGLILGPLVFSLILLFFEADGLSFEAKCILASTAWMAVWWVTECVPISVTALLPIVLFPLTGGMDLSTTTAAYGHKLVFLFVGGFMIALAIEKWHLHKRLALNIIRMTGSNKSRVILGFMLATAFLSMWISNTATSIMILPVGLAIISQLKDDPNTKENENEIFGKSLMIAIAYSASIGGMATLIGTPPNMVLAGVVEESYGIKLNMFDWMKFGVPLSSFLLMICWVYLTKIAFKFKNEEFSAGRDEILRQIKKLGSFSNEEIKVLIVFTLTALGWILRGSIEKIFPLIDDFLPSTEGMEMKHGRGRLQDQEEASSAHRKGSAQQKGSFFYHPHNQRGSQFKHPYLDVFVGGFDGDAEGDAEDHAGGTLQP